MCVLFVCFFFKSNLSALESKECRLKNQRACRQTNTLKLSRAQRQPNYAKPGGWFISAHLQSLPVLLSLLFSRVPRCKQRARVEENQPAILWNNGGRKKKHQSLLIEGALCLVRLHFQPIGSSAFCLPRGSSGFWNHRRCWPGKKKRP